MTGVARRVVFGAVAAAGAVLFAVTVAARAGGGCWPPAPPAAREDLPAGDGPGADDTTPARMTDPRQTTPFAEFTPSPEDQAAARGLIEQLMFADGPATNQPVRNPGINIFDADGKEVKPAGDADAEKRRERFEVCETAFQKLADSRWPPPG